MKNYLFIIFSVFLVSCMEENIPTPKNEITNVNVEYSIDDGTNKENGDFVYPSVYNGRPNMLELGVDSIIVNPTDFGTGLFVEVPSDGSFKVVVTGETPHMVGIESGGMNNMFISNIEIYKSEPYLVGYDTISVYDSTTLEHTYYLDSIIVKGDFYKYTFETNPSSERFTGSVMLSTGGMTSSYVIEYYELKSTPLGTSPMYSENPSKVRNVKVIQK